MGAVKSRLLRPLRNFNVVHRAERVISKKKPTLAPQYPSTEKQKKLADEINPNFMEHHYKKDSKLDDHLKTVFVTSTDSQAGEITSTKQLPQDKKRPPDFKYGVLEPSVIPEGKCSLSQALLFISKYNQNRTKRTIEEIAKEYKLDKKLVANIVKHFRIPQSHDLSKQRDRKVDNWYKKLNHK